MMLLLLWVRVLLEMVIAREKGPLLATS
jgi:hypothetical protein